MAGRCAARCRPGSRPRRGSRPARPQPLLPDLSASRALGARWSLCLVDADSSAVLVEESAYVVLPTASVGKLLVLAAAASLPPTLALSRSTVGPVGDSGLWQHLSVDALTVADLGLLVGSVSDNLATNVLLEHLGLPAAQAAGRSLGLSAQLLDRVRDVRGPDDPAHLSTGCAADWARFFGRLHRGEVDRAVSGQLLGYGAGTPAPPRSPRGAGWLAAGVDLSMVAGAFDLDPLAHGPADDPPYRLWHKTGADPGVRCDVGLVAHDGRAIAYAALCVFPDAPAALAAVMADHQRIGRVVRARLDGLGQAAEHRG